MTFLEALGAIGASFGVCLGASILPIGGGSEVYVVATSALLPSVYVFPLVLASAAGSVTAKVIIYLAANRAMSLPGFMQQKAGDGVVERVKARIQSGPWIRRGLIFVSATVTVPPFYVVALAAGALKTSLKEFILVSYLGQTIHFAAVWVIPQLVEHFGTAA